MRGAKVTAFGALIHVCAAMLVATVHADQPGIPRIGVLSVPTSYEEGLRDGLRALGYIEGENIAVDWRRSRGTDAELRSLAMELAQSKPDVIVTFGTPAARAASHIAAVPTVFLSSDPVASGLVTNLARPGGNATGVATAAPDLSAKLLQLLLRFAPQSRRIGCLVNTSNPVGALQLEQARKAARELDVELLKLDARSGAELDALLRAVPRSGLDEMLVTGDPLFLANRGKITAAMHKARLPAIFPTNEYRGEGVLASYGPSMREAGRMTAVYVDKILKGAKPGDLPVEQISKLELVIDLRVAHELSIKVPEELLYRADEVIR